MPRVKILYDYEAEKDEYHDEKTSPTGSKLYRRPWNTCDQPDTAAEHFYKHIVMTLYESDTKSLFTYALYKADDENPTGLLIQDQNAETSKYINSRIPGVKRTLDDAGFTYEHVTDKRYRDDNKPTQLIVTGHAIAGGELPLQVRFDIESPEPRPTGTKLLA